MIKSNMKFIKSVLIIFTLFLSMSFYGQKNDSLQNVTNTKSILYLSNFSSNDHLSIEKLNVQTKAASLVLYSRPTNSYDTYLDSNGVYSYSGSSTIFKNKSNFFTTLFLGNDSFIESNTLLLNKSLLLEEDVSYRVRDSFNPNGASNFSEAVLGGVLGLLFN